jgi:hypothetical protein
MSFSASSFLSAVNYTIEIPVPATVDVSSSSSSLDEPPLVVSVFDPSVFLFTDSDFKSFLVELVSVFVVEELSSSSSPDSSSLFDELVVLVVLTVLGGVLSLH